MCSTNCYAAKFNMLVVPNDLFLEQTNMVFQKSATVIGTDIINYYNQQDDMSAVSINQLRAYLEKPENYRLKKEVKKFLNDYQSGYVINFATVQKLASRFNSNKVLLINCNMDAQNYITRRTLWDFLNIPGATVVDPAYRLTTEVNLIDVNNQMTLWQHNYQKLISSRESRMITPTLGDSSEQLEKIKKYSIKFLSPQIVQETQLALYKMSPYQDLNLHTEIVKPQYVSIDKIKVDSKRAGVRGSRYMKQTSIMAGQTVAAESVKFGKKAKKHFIKFKNDVSQNIAEQKLLEQKENALTVEEQIKQMQDEELAKLELKKQKQKLKLEKQKQKAQLKAAKKQAKMQAKLELQQEKQKLLEQNEPVKEVKSVKVKVKKVKNKSKKVKKEEKQPEIIEVKTPTKTEVVPSSKIIRQDYKPAPYIRTKTNIREQNYTINDF